MTLLYLSTINCKVACLNSPTPACNQLQTLCSLIAVQILEEDET